MKIKQDPLLSVISQYLKILCDSKCEVCGEHHDRLECHHFIGRRYNGTRYDLDNLIMVCFSCHQRLHNNPILHYEWFVLRRGSKKADELIAKSLFITKRMKPSEMKEKIKEYKEKIKELE